MKKLIVFIICCSTLLFSGCSFGTFSVDTLLVAPKLTQEQQEIHEGLIAKVGSNITLKYPKDGANRSAYVIVNIDDEPTDEAIVFFEYNTSQFNAGTAADNGEVHFCVLDKDENGKWTAVSEQAGAGTDVDRIIVTRLDNSGKISIIVGYSTLTINDKIMDIYTYSDGIVETVAEDTYSVLETLDINNDGYSEIITVQSGGENTPATASLLSTSEGQIVGKNVINMSERFQYVVSYVKGKATRSNKALFIDCRYAEGQINTEFIYYKYDALQNPVAQIGDELADLTVRPDGYYSADVDGDGIIEIPTVVPMTGYELAAAEDQLYLTTWSEYQDYYKLTPKLVGYYSISNGYMMSFPDRWLYSVTVKKDDVTGENVFYKFSADLENSDTELMRIAVTSREVTEEYVRNGYQRIKSVGQIDYLVKLPADSVGDLSIGLSEIKSNFFVVA